MIHESNKITVCVLGAGSWGIALANYCRGIGHDVNLWEFDPDAARELAVTRQRDKVLKVI